MSELKEAARVRLVQMLKTDKCQGLSEVQDSHIKNELYALLSNFFEVSLLSTAYSSESGGRLVLEIRAEITKVHPQSVTLD